MKNIRIPISFAAVICFAFPAYADMSVDLDTIVVSNARINQKDYKLASNVTVITQKQIAASNAQSIPDLLREAQGVTVYDNSTNKTAIIDMRGFGDSASRNVLILINDRKVNSIDVSGPDLEQIPMGAVERIEIIRGAGSVLYGDNAVGGVINIITKKGEGELHGKVGGVIGSYRSRGAHLELAGEKEKLSYFLYSKYMDGRGYRRNSDELAKDFNTHLGYQIFDRYSADVEVGWHEDDSGLPGGLSDSEIQTLGRRGTAFPDDTSSTTDRYVKVGLDGKPVINNTELGELAIDFLYRNKDTFDSFNRFGPFHTNRRIDTYGITGKYVFSRPVFDREIDFVTGIDYYDHTNDILGSGDNVDKITISKEEFGVYEYAQIETLDNLFVSTGTRYNRSTYEFNQHNVVVNAQETPDKWVNMGGLKYEYGKGSNLHFNWQQTFRFLATDEWYSTANFPGFGITPGLNLDLKQQSGVQYEVGLRHNWNNRFLWDITPYLMVNDNEIFFDPAAFGNSNYDKTRRVGLEFGQKIDLLKFIDLPLLDRLDLVTNYTYQNAKFDKGANNGKFIPMVPQHEVSQSLVVRIFQNYDFSLTGRYVGSRFAINDVRNETSPVKPYAVLDAKIAYKREYFEIFVGVNNILDRQYSNYVSKSTTSSNKLYYPSPERNFSMGVDVKF